MRCTNCGYGGEPNDGRCEKCNFPIKEGPVAPPSAPVAPPPAPGVLLKGTIPAAPSAERSWDGGESPSPAPAPNPSPAKDTSCSNCGYMLSVPGALCPSCGAGQNGKASLRPNDPTPVLPPPPAPAPVSPPKAPQNKFAGTIDPYNVGPSSQQFRLVPVIDGQEQEADALEYSGPKVKLNRDNVDPGNPSITSKVQASIVQVEGVWYILDKSALRTTFVQAGSPIPVKEGDVIIVGNRRFVFR